MRRRFSAFFLAGILVPLLAFGFAGCNAPDHAANPGAVVKPAYEKVLADTNAAIHKYHWNYWNIELWLYLLPVVILIVQSIIILLLED